MSSEAVRRRLQAFQQQHAPNALPSDVKLRRLRLAALVKAPVYADLKAIAEHVVTPQSAAIPNATSTIGGVIGYFTFGVVRDAIGQFFELLEAEAAQAKQEEPDE